MRLQSSGGVRAIKREHLGFDTELGNVDAAYFEEAPSIVSVLPVSDAVNTKEDARRVGLARPADVQKLGRALRRESNEWHNAFSCMVQDDQYVNMNSYEPFYLDTVNLNGEGLYVDSAYPRTYFRASRRTRGVYRFGFLAMLNFSVPMGVDQVHGFFCIDGNPVRAMRSENAKRTGDGAGNPIRTTIIDGTAILPAEVGTEITVVVRIDNGGGAGTQLLIHPSSIYAHFDGERVSCEIDIATPMPLTDHNVLPPFL